MSTQDQLINIKKDNNNILKKYNEIIKNLEIIEEALKQKINIQNEYYNEIIKIYINSVEQCQHIYNKDAVI